MKQDRRGWAGSKPSRGWPNPEDGTERAGKTRESWIGPPASAVGPTTSRKLPVAERWLARGGGSETLEGRVTAGKSAGPIHLARLGRR